MRLGVAFLALLCLAATNAPARGGWFPDNLLDSGDRAVLVAPKLRFGDELERMQLVQTRWRAVTSTNDYAQEAADAEIADLTAALRKLKTTQPEIERICEAHRAERAKLESFAAEFEHWKYSGGWDNDADRLLPPRGEPPQFLDVKFTPGLPEEFVDYFDGACAWRRDQRAKARAAWERLLARPEAERKFKSTWAAFMLGKLLEKEDPAKAREFFQQVRNLAKRGFADSIGLATASLGLEARINLNEKQFEKAIELYLEQLAAGDYSAIESLRVTARDAVESDSSDEQLVALAKNPRVQKVITAYLISCGPAFTRIDDETNDQTDSPAARWLNAVEKADVRDVESAEKLALAAYQNGSVALTQRWIKRAPGSPLAQWLQAKLLLRDGKVAQAASLLARVSRSFPIEERGTNPPVYFTDNLYVPFSAPWRSTTDIGAQALGEFGVLQLSRRQYTDALDSLLRSGYWRDAAYVAERVLTLDELKNYVDQNWPAPKFDTNNAAEMEQQISATDQTAMDIRYLLARRLTREQRGFQAREYFPREWQPKSDELSTALNDGWNETLPKEQRARALFTAAIIARTNGMELCGTELAPDWFVHGGDFEYGLTAKRRTNENVKILPAGADELRRAFTHNADPEVRFHYRYQAAFLAWEAARMLPNNSDETARVLCMAGSWLKNRDPDTADLFYKNLVKRCRKTAIGEEADRIRWFPELDENGNVIPRTLHQNMTQENEFTPVEDSLPEPEADESIESDDNTASVTEAQQPIILAPQ